MSSAAVFECFVCRGVFASPGLSVGSLDPSLGVPGDWRAGEVCDHCVPGVLTAAGARSAAPVTATAVTAAGPVVTAALDSTNVERRACDECGEPFEAARADARYCSGTCRMRAHRRRRELALPVIDETKE
jgi:hypothetical protein